VTEGRRLLVHTSVSCRAWRQPALAAHRPKNRTNAMTDIDKTNNQIAPIVAESEEERIQSTAFWFAVAVAVGGGIVFLYTIYIVAVGFRYWEELLRDHFAAIIGLPAAAALAFALVVFLRQTDGPIEFEGLGFKFKGAAGQVAMWIACFLAVSAAIKFCW
jgi:hypothetical protein